MEEFGGGDDGLPEEAGAPAWMATFGDMMSLLLTFFVLLLSFAQMDVVKFRDMMGSIRDAFGVQFEHPGEYEGRTTSVVELSKQEATDTIAVIETKAQWQPADEAAAKIDQEIAEELERAIAENGLEGEAGVDIDGRGVVLRLSGQLLFAPASDELLPEARPLLDGVAALARDFPRDLAIEGHTDDLPISTQRFPSNWHLSAGRAIAALRYLAEKGHVDPRRLSGAGFGAMLPRVPNDSATHRAQNRRIEFVFHAPRKRGRSLPASPAR